MPAVAQTTNQTPALDARANPIAYLKAHHRSFPEKDRMFIGSLIKADARYGLTQKQEFWAKKLATQHAEGPKDAPKEQVGSLDAIETMINSAKKTGLKHPRITIETPDGDRIQISMAGTKSRYAGSLNVTDGGSFGSNVWYGRVSKGTFVMNTGLAESNPRELARVAGFLVRLADNPTETISAYGKRSGYCACCNRKLTDPESLARGVGPVCASNFGLGR